jgi:hypothetical protein
VYLRPESEVADGPGQGGRRTRVGHRNQTPNLFGAPAAETQKNEEESPSAEDPQAAGGESGSASLADVSAAEGEAPAEEAPPQKPRFDPFKAFRRSGN